MAEFFLVGVDGLTYDDRLADIVNSAEEGGSQIPAGIAIDAGIIHVEATKDIVFRTVFKLCHRVWFGFGGMMAHPTT